MQTRDRMWSDFSFVTSSSYREKIITALASTPKQPRDLERETNVSLTHVSRSLRELRSRGLVECLTPSTKTHGRVYALTKVGSSVVGYMQASVKRLPTRGPDSSASPFVPKIRAASAVRLIEHLRATRGTTTVLTALQEWSVDPEELSPDTWLSADAFDQFLEFLVTKLGDGKYDFLRQLCSDVIPTVPSIRAQIAKVIPFSVVAELAPIGYSKELNYGRLVVRRGRRQVRFQHFDWVPAPAFCAAAHGTYEGVLRARGIQGTVRKSRCVRSGDDHCEYVVRW